MARAGENTECKSEKVALCVVAALGRLLALSLPSRLDAAFLLAGMVRSQWPERTRRGGEQTRPCMGAGE